MHNFPPWVLPYTKAFLAIPHTWLIKRLSLKVRLFLGKGCVWLIEFIECVIFFHLDIMVWIWSHGFFVLNPTTNPFLIPCTCNLVDKHACFGCLVQVWWSYFNFLIFSLLNSKQFWHGVHNNVYLWLEYIGFLKTLTFGF